MAPGRSEIFLSVFVPYAPAMDVHAAWSVAGRD